MRKLAIVLLWILASAAIVGAQTNINNGGGGGGVTSVTGTAPVQSSGGATPAISLTTPFQQSIAPNQNAIYLSPNCGTQTNCVTVPGIRRYSVRMRHPPACDYRNRPTGI